LKDNQQSLFSKLTQRKIKGNKAEDQACQFLQDKGLKLKQRNFSTKLGEVDLIMQGGETPDDNLLVFVEVRYRKNSDFGGAAMSVTPKKQQRIIKAALAYQQKNAPQASMRFDVVAIEGEGNNRQINWIPNAFYGY